MAVDRFAGFSEALREASHGSLEPLVIETRQAIVPLA
jgi:hypothetical protein